MVSDLAAADAATKVLYWDPPHNLIVDEIVALQKVESGAKHVSANGVKAEFLVTVARNQGTGARAEKEDLPIAGQTRDVNAEVFLKWQYHTIEGTGQVFALVQGNPGAYVNWMNREMDRATIDFKVDLSRQVYGDGTGTLATITATATATTTLTVDDSHWLEEGMTIDVLTAATLANPTPTKGNTALLTISAINTATNVVTVTGGTVTAATSSVLVRSGGTVNSWKKEWEGLGLIVSNTAPLHGIDPAVEAKWKPGYIESSVGTLAELDLTHLIDAVKKKGGRITDFLTTPGVANAYWLTLQGLRQFNGNEQMKGGAVTPVFQSTRGNIPFTIDDMAPAGTLYGLNPSQMFLHETKKMHWMSETGAIWNRVGRKDQFEATMRYYSNIGVFERNNFAKLTGITEG